MQIILLRCGHRALLLPHGKDLIDCPLRVRHWLSAPYTRCATEITPDTPLPGLSPPVVLAEILQKGFCALDTHGVVQDFEAPLPADFTEEIARDTDPQAMDSLRGASVQPETRADT